MKAKDIMDKHIYKVKKDAAIKEIVVLMLKHSLNGLPVVDEEDKLVGKIKIDDLIKRKAHLAHFLPMLATKDAYSVMEELKDELKKTEAVAASEIMDKDVRAIEDDTDVNEIADIIINENRYFLAVIKDEKLVGVITKLDILKSLLKEPA